MPSPGLRGVSEGLIHSQARWEPAKPSPIGFAGSATTLRRGFTTNRVLYVATLSIGLYLLLEGAIPTAKLYPKRRGVNKQFARAPRIARKPRSLY